MAKTIRSAAEANVPFRFLRAVGRGLFRVLFHIRAEGLQAIPSGGGYVLVCNHLSWIDPLILMATLPAEPRIHWLAAAEFTTEGPWWARTIVNLAGGIIPVDRQSQKGNRAVVVQSLHVLRGGGILGIFPEGKCGTEEGSIQPLKEGAALFATRTGKPVLVAGLSGTFELCFRRRIRLRAGPLLEPGPAETQDEFLARVGQAMVDVIPPLDPNQPKIKLLTSLNRVV